MAQVERRVKESLGRIQYSVMRTLRSMMLVSLTLAATAMTIGASANAMQDKVTIKFNPKLDAVVVHQLQLELSVLSTTAVVKADLTSTATGLKDTVYDYKAEFKDLTIDVGGSDPGIGAQELKAKVGDDNTLRKIEGGIQGNDAARLYLLLQFLAPKAEIGVGETYTIDVAERKEELIPAYKFVSKYVGPAKVGEQDGFKFETKLTEAGDGLSSTGTFIVNKDGIVLSVDAKFKNLPIPAVGQSVEGSIAAKIKP